MEIDGMWHDGGPDDPDGEEKVGLAAEVGD